MPGIENIDFADRVTENVGPEWLWALGSGLWALGCGLGALGSGLRLMVLVGLWASGSALDGTE